MSNDVISDWITKAKTTPAPEPSAGIQVIRREPDRGGLILEIADRIRPWLSKMFDGVRDDNNMLVQPAHVHGIALNMAQKIVNEQEEKRKKSA